MLQTLDWVQQCQNTHLIVAVDYETTHCCFGHLSQEVLRCAREHTIDFPNIEIFTDNPICCHIRL